MIRFSSTYLFLALAAVALTSVACDSNGDDDNDAPGAAFVGEWYLDGVEDQSGDRFDEVADDYVEITVMFEANGNAGINADGIDNADDVSVLGSYTVSAASESLTLTLTVPGIGSVPLTFGYDFLNDDRVELTASGLTVTALNAVLGSTLAGSVTMTFERE